MAGTAQTMEKAREINAQRREEKIRARRENIIKILIDAKGEPVSVPEIASVFGMDIEAIRRDITKFIMPEHNEVVKVPYKGFAYVTPEKKPAKNLDIFKEEPIVKEVGSVVEEKKVNPMKNAEGYTDTTAGRAIMEVDGPEEGPAFAKAGDVYDCSCSDGSTLRYLILTSFEKFSIGLVLNPTKSKDVPKKYSRRIQAGLDIRFTDIRRVTTKPNKYMTQKVGHLGGEIFDSILKDTVRVFTMNDSDAVSDPDMWNALNAREKDLDKREAHLDERAKDILKQQMDTDAVINRYQEMRDEVTQRQIELEAANKEFDRRVEAFNKRVAREQGSGCGISETEVALLKQKVEIYEKLIFERGISL